MALKTSSFTLLSVTRLPDITEKKNSDASNEITPINKAVLSEKRLVIESKMNRIGVLAGISNPDAALLASRYFGSLWTMLP